MYVCVFIHVYIHTHRYIRFSTKKGIWLCQQVWSTTFTLFDSYFSIQNRRLRGLSVHLCAWPASADPHYIFDMAYDIKICNSISIPFYFSQGLNTREESSQRINSHPHPVSPTYTARGRMGEERQRTCEIHVVHVNTRIYTYLHIYIFKYSCIFAYTCDISTSMCLCI